MCSEKSTTFVRWGKAMETQSGEFCGVHVGELWDRCKSGVAVGTLMWIQDVPGWIKARKNQA